MSIEILKVSSKTNPKKTAGAISAILNRESELHIHSIGAGALNQAVKAVIIARGMIATSGFDLVVIPAFTQIFINTEERTAIKLIIQKKEI